MEKFSRGCAVSVPIPQNHSGMVLFNDTLWKEKLGIEQTGYKEYWPLGNTPVNTMDSLERKWLKPIKYSHSKDKWPGSNCHILDSLQKEKRLPATRWIDSIIAAIGRHEELAWGQIILEKIYMAAKSWCQFDAI